MRNTQCFQQSEEGARFAMSHKNGFTGTALFIALLLLVPQLALMMFFGGR